MIVFEGIDKVGKNTQAMLLRDYLDKHGLPSVVISYPGYHLTSFGKLIRQYLDGRWGPADKVDPKFAAYLYAGDRFETLPALRLARERYPVVILDRYVASNIVFQGIKAGSFTRFQKWVETLEYELIGLPREDATILIHCEFNTIKQHLSSGDIHENN
jgi:dTMP kinase